MTKDCPYVGLNYFLEADADYFFGREVESRRVIGNLLATRLTLLYAQSGVGKSSLLRAGAAATLRSAARATFEEDGAPDFVPVVFSAWHGDVETSLADAIVAAAQPFAGEIDVRKETFEATLAHAVEVVDAPLLLILDQFEEFFLYHGADEEGAKFADALARCVLDPDLRANFLLSIREDAYASIGEHFKARIPNVYGNFLYLEYLDEEAARAAISKPLEQYNRSNGTRVEIEPALVDDVLDGIRRQGAARYESAYLQLVMEEIWRLEMASDSPTLRQETLFVRGGAPEIIRSLLMRAIDKLSPEQTTLAANAFRHLVTSNGTKIALTAGELAEMAELDQAELEPVLAHLLRARMLREVERGEHGVRYELFHDRLGPPVVEWRREHLAAVREARRYTEERREAELKEARLNRMLETEQVRGVRRTRIAFFVVSGLFVLAMLVAVLAVQQRRTAIDQANIARSRALAADSAGLLAIDPERSLIAARQAATLDPTTEAVAALRSALSTSRVRARWRLGPVDQASVSADGRLLVTAAGRRARLWRTRNGRELANETFQPSVHAVTLGTRGQTALVTTGAKVYVIGPDAPRTLFNGGATVDSVSVDAGGTRVAIKTIDDVVSVVDVATGRTVARSEMLGPVVFDPQDPSALVTSDCRDAPQRVSATSTEEVLSGDVVSGCTISVSPDGQHSVNYDARGLVRLWDIPRGRPLRSMVDSVDLVSAVAWSPDGERLAIAGGTLATVLSARTGITLARLAGHSDVISSVAFSASGAELVTTSRDGTARTWEARNGKPLVTLLGHKNDVLDAAFLPGDRGIATASTDGTARRWQVEQGGVLRENNRVLSVAFAPNGRQVASASRDGSARLWDLTTQVATRVRVSRPRARVLNSVAFDPTGRRVVLAGEDRLRRALLIITDAATRRSIGSYRSRDDAFLSARFSPDGSQIVATTIQRVIVLDVGTLRVLPVTLGRPPGAYTSAEFTPGGREILAARDDGSAVILDLRSRNVRPYGPAPGALAGATMSPDGRRILMFGSNAVAQIVDATSGQLLARLTGHTAPVTSGAFSPDGATVVTASADRTTRVWDASNGELLSTQAYHGDGVNSVAYSRDGGTIVSGSDDWTVRLYPCATCGSLGRLLALARVRTP
ncbi:hypothetical protein OM076_21515 [Solirubrobacter ginsenosidimutans]|uniref:Novel STAND NTPase 1 domain-containing protein n=1 Tax=Solirubrobacter ginsenosidimutans TaxID=490573 RepID=A0A9X3MUZ6_9ACTN|nr:hypothetical protein [Solirubrobacter ginsenosidimutans]MDA0162867.1 hypothetical protein [Solirubrobacter ginsenosidimutans]